MKKANQKKHGGKRALARDLQAKGFTARKAAEAVDTVFQFMTEALSYHEPIEVPGVGKLEVVVQRGRPARRSQKSRNIGTKQIQVHDVDFPGRRRVIKLKPNPNLKLAVSPPPTPARPEGLKELLSTVSSTATPPLHAGPDCDCLVCRLAGQGR